MYITVQNDPHCPDLNSFLKLLIKPTTAGAENRFQECRDNAGSRDFVCFLNSGGSGAVILDLSSIEFLNFKKKLPVDPLNVLMFLCDDDDTD